MQAIEWWYNWIVSAGIEPQRAVTYAQSMQENNMDTSHLRELNNHILLDLGIIEHNDRILILRRIRLWIEQINKASNKIYIRNEAHREQTGEDFCSFYPRKRRRNEDSLPSEKTRSKFVKNVNSITTSTIENLPTEVLEDIFMRLPLISWRNLMSVCSKLFHFLNSDKWWTRIERLSISPRTKLKGEKFYHFASMMSNLKLLNIRGRFAGSSSGTAKFVSNCPNLTDLTIREDEITDEIVEVIGKCCPNIQKLSLEYMHTDSLHPILKNGNIFSISLVQLGFVNMSSFGDMCMAFGTQLVELCLDEFGGDLDLQFLGRSIFHRFLISGKWCPNLKKLSANYVDSPILGMEHFIRGCTKLEYLSIIGGDIHNFAFPQQLGNFDLAMLPVCLKNVKELWLNKLLNQQGDFIKMLTNKGWPSLQFLSIAGFEYVHFTEVRQLLEVNSGLTSLVLYECYNVSLEDISELQAIFPSVLFHFGQKYPGLNKHF